MTQAELNWFADPTGATVRDWHAHGPVGEAIRRFFIGRYGSRMIPARVNGLTVPREFRADILIDYVSDQPDAKCSQASVTRILRLMRTDGMLDYKTVGARCKGVYRILGVRVSKSEILGAIRWDGETKA